MEINNSFDVPLPPADAWKVLMDIERIAPCMPGAELTGVVDKETYNGKVSVKLGPVALAFEAFRYCNLSSLTGTPTIIPPRR